MSNVLFFPVKYQPSKLELIRLNRIQEDIYFCKVSLHNKLRGLNDYQRWLSVERFYTDMRSRLKEAKASEDIS